MSNGTIVNHIKKLSFNLEEILNKVKDKILNSRKMYTDATTSRCNNRNISVRNYSTDEHTLLCATNTKSKSDLEKNRYIITIFRNIASLYVNYYSPSLNSNLTAGK